MIISELMRNDVIRIYTRDKLRSFLAIVDESGATNQKYGIYFWAKVETEAGRKIEIDDTWDFVKVNEPFTRKIKYSGDAEMKIDVVDKITGSKFTTDVKEQEVDIPSNTSIYKEEKENNIPDHYKGSENIDVIDFLYQQLPFEQFKGFMKGNMIKYPVRAGRKDDELADFKKARDYADRLIEKMEAKQ
ncbi:DUF3310 domain-containing protein [Staphylococcus haemolyticus]|uniref:DUF3310 domain-containing protein n=1 Tax=Staphylococcus haemolyticus TaxID=1283 RepID=UPI0020C7DDF2|nr:DUF3310 domain-containing protein [Staphylococcus haemolyticus]